VFAIGDTVALNQLPGVAEVAMQLGDHLTFLTGFKNRFTCLLHWANTFPGGWRAERAITFAQVMARVAIGQAGGDTFMQVLIPIPGTGTEPELEAAPEQNG
jgi:NADH:ubiquinone reductase (H+-translocating)